MHHPIDPHIAAWALARLKRRSPDAAAKVEAYQSRIVRDCRGDPERVLRADPVSIGVGVLSLIGITGASTFVAGAIGYGVIIAASIGLNYAARALQGNGPLAAAPINDISIKYNERQPIPSKRIIYGTAQVGGALFFERVKPPYLYQGFLICAEQINAFKKMWIGTQEISFASFVPNSILTPLAVSGQPNYAARLQVSLRLGSPTQTIDPLLAADFPSLDSGFRQQGIATVVVRYHFGTDQTEFTALWGQVQKPNPLFLVEGVALPDPRVPGHILSWNPSDSASIAAARATWAFSNNASLVQAHYLTQPYGGRINPANALWDQIVTAANFDDDLVYCLDGTYQKRYTIDGVVTLNQSPSDVIAGMISANRGFVLESAGKVWVTSSKPRTPVATIHDGILTGAVSIRSAKPKRDVINRLKTRFVAPDRQYQLSDGPVLSRTDLQTIDGEVLDATLSLPFTLDNRRAQRLGKAFVSAGRLGKEIACRCDVSLLASCKDELVGSAVTFNSTLFSQGNGTYFCTGWGFADGYASIDVSLTEYNPTIETDWIAANDEKPFALAALNVS